MTKKKVLKQNHQLQIFLHSGERERERERNPTSSAVPPPPPQVAHFSAIARMSIESNVLCSSIHHKLPLMSAMARMSNQNVSGFGNKSHKTKNIIKCAT